MILDLAPSDLKRQKFKFEPLSEPNLRISVYEEPEPDHNYVMGFDAAYGIMGRDSDAVVVLDKDTDPVRQVGEIQGWIGERFDRVLYAAAMYWNGAFIVGERQVGLPILRRLYDEFGYTYMYYERSEAARTRRLSDKLGHHRGRDDVTLRNLRLAVVQNQVELRSEILIDQMSRVEFREPKTPEDGERPEDRTLKIALLGGGSPDIVMALCYAWHGINQISHFPKPEETYAPDTYGAILGHADFEAESKPRQLSWVNGRV